MKSYTLKEMMAIMAAREINNGDIVFCGTGISMLAAMAAKHIHAPSCTLFFETGAIDSTLEEVPLAVSDPRVMNQASVHGNLVDSFSIMQNRFTGKRITGIMGAAQIDIHGNLNSTVIGNYDHPDVRFSGSGGASDVSSFVGKTIIFMKHEKRKFVKKLDYLTSPGWMSGYNSRVKCGYRENGPAVVITDLAVMRFHKTTRKMYLDQYYPGVDMNSIRKNMEFSVDMVQAEEAKPPSEMELSILRDTCDPEGHILKP